MTWNNKGLTLTSSGFQKPGQNTFLILAVLWVFLWVFPWTSWLHSNWIRIGLSILILATPGIMISFFLAGKKLSLTSHFTSGLAISIFLVGSLGLLGRVFQLPFDFVKHLFALIGLSLLLGLAKHTRSGYQWYEPRNFSIVTPILLLLAIILGVLISFRFSSFGGDDFSYLAYLTNWQHAQPLDFREVIFGSGNTDHIRFWLAMLPMAWALLAEISNVHGLLLLGFYLEPYLITIAILSAFNLCKDLLKTKYQPASALLLQFTFFFLLTGAQQPGQTFFMRLSEDKAFAAFILAPVFFIVVHYFLESFTLYSGIFLLLTGLSLALTHPVILAYSIFIVAVFATIVTLTRKEYKKLGLSALLMAAILLPSASLRFIDAPSAPVSFDLETALNTSKIDLRITYIEGTPFYGFNVERVQIRTANTDNQETTWQVFFSWSYLWIVGIGFLWSLFNLKRNFIAPFITATSLLVLLCAIPYTGWLFGYFVTARMLWRAPWLLPIGLIGAVLLVELLGFAARKLPSHMQLKIPREQVALGLMLSLCLALVGYFSISVYKTNWLPTKQLVSYRNSLARLATLGNDLENRIEQPSLFVAPRGILNYLPGLSSNSKVGLFRNANYSRTYITDPLDYGRVKLVLSPNPSVPLQQRLNILKEEKVKYMVTEQPSAMKYYANHSKFFRVWEAGDFWVIEFLEIDT